MFHYVPVACTLSSTSVYQFLLCLALVFSKHVDRILKFTFANNSANMDRLCIVSSRQEPMLMCMFSTMYMLRAFLVNGLQLQLCQWSEGI